LLNSIGCLSPLSSFWGALHTDADGEQQETRHWLDTAADCGYLTRSQADDLVGKCAEVGRLLGGMMAKAHLFCGMTVAAIREPAADYFIGDHNH